MPILWTKTPFEAGVKAGNRLIYKQVINKFESRSLRKVLQINDLWGFCFI